MTLLFSRTEQIVEIMVVETDTSTPVTCCGRAGCTCGQLQLEYIPGWREASLTSFYAHGCSSAGNPCAAMDTYIYLDGAAFDLDTSYACHFRAPNNPSVNRTTSANAPMSASKVACQLPGNAGVAAWSAGAGV